MKYLKLFESLYNIHEICKKYNIKNYTINSDGSIDVDGYVYLSDRELTKLPLKFRNIDGSFYCHRNNLTSLDGSPTYVGGHFSCYRNNLTSLEGAPNQVGSYFNCTFNRLTSLEGCLTSVSGDFNCGYNNITSLEGVPLHIGGNFYCKSNPVHEIWKLFEDKSKIELFNDYDIIRGTDIVIDRLNDFLITIGKDLVESVKDIIIYSIMKYLKLFESLDNINEICKRYNIKNYTINSDGSIDVDGNVDLSFMNLIKLPVKFRNVSGYFDCHDNNLTSLEGSPAHVGSNFDCSDNNLTSLEGSPTYVGCHFYCYHNKITNLEGLQTHIGGVFNIWFNPVYEIWKLFKDKSKVELFNDYDIIRGTDIAIDRLNDFLITIGKKPVESVKGYNNI